MWTWSSVWKMAGVLGIDWHNQTLRSLWIMYQSRLLDTWDHTSVMTASWQMGKRKKTPAQLHPFRSHGKKRSVTPENIEQLGVFL